MPAPPVPGPTFGSRDAQAAYGDGTQTGTLEAAHRLTSDLRHDLVRVALAPSVSRRQFRVRSAAATAVPDHMPALTGRRRPSRVRAALAMSGRDLSSLVSRWVPRAAFNLAHRSSVQPWIRQLGLVANGRPFDLRGTIPWPTFPPAGSQVSNVGAAAGRTDEGSMPRAGHGSGVVPSAPGGDLRAKRALDIVLSSVLIVDLLPIFGLCALAIRLESRGPIFFRQTRVGKDGKPFMMLKFRSMHVDSDAGAHQAFVAGFICGTVQGQSTDNGQVYKLVHDTRVTRVGRWLRKTSLDELPQLFNVLRGEMSLVGPRPPLPYEVAHYTPADLGRLGATPGITGLWQVSGRSKTTFAEMVALDLEYIRTRSLRTDLAILLKTIPVVLEGAY